MTSKPVVLLDPITELPTLVERKSKQTALSDRPVPMSLPINDLSYLQVVQQAIVVCIYLHQVDVKNIVKRWKDLLWYSITP